MEGLKLIDIDKLPKSPGPRYGHTTVIVSNRLYLFGGSSLDGKIFYNDIQILDLESMKWKKCHLAEDKIKGRHFHSCVTTDPEDLETANLIFFGGKSNGYFNNIFSFRCSTNKFEIIEPRLKNEEKISSCRNDGVHPPSMRYGHSACYYNDMMFIFGGYDRNGFTKNDLYGFNLKKNMWRRFITTRIPYRYHHSGVCINGNYFILGGITKTYRPLDDVYRLDLTKVLWEDEDDHGVEAFELSVENPIASYGHKCFFHNDRIYMYGGRDEVQEFEHILRLEHCEGNLRWEAQPKSVVDENKLQLSYGTLDLYDSHLLFYGGQHRGRKTYPFKNDIAEKQRKVEEFRNIDFSLAEEILPYDIIFHILSYLTESDLVRLCSTTTKKHWSFSRCARSDRIWGKKYEEMKEKSNLGKLRMKMVKRQKTTYEKYRKLKYLEMIQNREEMSKGGAFLKKGKGVAPGNFSRTQQLKMVLVGDGAVGKTCLGISYMMNMFPDDYVPTVFDNYVATVPYDGNVVSRKSISLSVWDTAGEICYDLLRPLSYPGTDVFVICFSMVSPTSLRNVERKWKPEIQRYFDGRFEDHVNNERELFLQELGSTNFPNRYTEEHGYRRGVVPIVLCGTKLDLVEDAQIHRELAEREEKPVTREQGLAMAKKIGATAYFETSSKTQKWVKEMFQAVVLIGMGDDWMKVSGNEGNEGKEKCGIM